MRFVEASLPRVIRTAAAHTQLHHDPKLHTDDKAVVHARHKRALYLAQNMDLLLHRIQLLGGHVQLHNFDGNGSAC